MAKTERIQVRLTVETKKKLELVAGKERRSLSQMAEIMIEDFLKNRVDLELKRS